MPTNSQDDKSWHLDRRVPLALMISLFSTVVVVSMHIAETAAFAKMRGTARSSVG